MTYQINFTDPTKLPFSIPDGKLNGPQGADPTSSTPEDPSNPFINTSLLLYGRNAPNYGEHIQENLLHLMENFAGPTPPVQPTYGQLWYDTSVTPPQLRIFSNSLVWENAKGVFVSATTPTNANTGDLWFDLLGQQLRIFNGTVWISVAANYVAKAGDTLNTGANITFVGGGEVIGLPATPSATAATSKEYVDTQDSLKVNIAGDTMTGFLTLNADPTNALHAATKQYVDAMATSTDHGLLSGLGDDDHLQYHNDARGDARYYTKAQLDAGQLDSQYVNISGDTMTGFLILPADPITGLGAATKNYVDTQIATHNHDTTYVNVTGDNMTGALTINGNTVWHAGNDGAGSGLDADLLDGAQYSAIVNRANHTGTQAPTTISAGAFSSGVYPLISSQVRDNVSNTLNPDAVINGPAALTNVATDSTVTNLVAGDLIIFNAEWSFRIFNLDTDFQLVNKYTGTASVYFMNAGGLIRHFAHASALADSVGNNRFVGFGGIGYVQSSGTFSAVFAASVQLAGSIRVNSVSFRYIVLRNS